MKFIHVLLVCLFACASSQAQQSPVKALLGGNINYFSSHYKDDDGQGAPYNDAFTFQIGLHPYLGIWIDAHWVLGLKAGIDFNHHSYDGISNPTGYAFNTNTYSLSLFGRRYFGGEKPLRFFLEPGVGYSFFNFGAKKEIPVFSTVTASKEFSGGVAPGISWSVNRHINLLARFGRLQFSAGKYQVGRLDKYYKYHDFNFMADGQSLVFGVELKLGQPKSN